MGRDEAQSFAISAGEGIVSHRPGLAPFVDECADIPSGRKRVRAAEEHPIGSAGGGERHEPMPFDGEGVEGTSPEQVRGEGDWGRPRVERSGSQHDDLGLVPETAIGYGGLEHGAIGREVAAVCGPFAVVARESGLQGQHRGVRMVASPFSPEGAQ